MIYNSKFLAKKMQYHSNMTELNHLGAALLTKPTKLLPYMNKLFSATSYYSDNPLFSTLQKMGSTKKETGLEWEYEMLGASTKPLILIEDLEPGNTTKGKRNDYFKILGDDNWALPGDVLSPGNVNYQARVVKKDGAKGTKGFVYILRMNDDNPASFIPEKYFRKGTKWNKLYSIYGEASEQAGSTQFSTPMTLKGRATKIRKKYKITDYALTEVLAVQIPDEKGRLHKAWLRYAEAEYWMQWYREVERLLWYSKDTSTVKDSNSRVAKSGAGVDEQLKADAWQQGYNVLTARVIEDFVLGILYGRKEPGNARAGLMGFAGDYGMLNFHRAIMDLNEKRGFIRDINTVQKKIKSPYHTNAYESGLQYVRYLMSNGATLEMTHNPIQDDSEIHNELDPITGYPIESQKIYLLDMSKRGKQNNVILTEKKDSYSLVYVEGTISPFGPKVNKSAAHIGEYYEMAVSHALGVQIVDPTSCGVLYKNF